MPPAAGGTPPACHRLTPAPLCLRSVRGDGQKHFDPHHHHQTFGEDHQPPCGASLLPRLPAAGAGHTQQQPHALQERALPHLHGEPHVCHLSEVSTGRGHGGAARVSSHPWELRVGWCCPSPRPAEPPLSPAATPGCSSCRRASRTTRSSASPAATARTASLWCAGATPAPRPCCCAREGCTARASWGSSSPRTPPPQVPVPLTPGSAVLGRAAAPSRARGGVLMLLALSQAPRRQTPPVWSRKSICRP